MEEKKVCCYQLKQKKHKWCGQQILREKFPKLYKISTDPNASLNDMVEWNANDCSWLFQFKRQLKLEEELWLQELIQLMGNPPIQQQGSEDEV
ncbi:hypothetical protein BVC80_9089g14 [Macleaya cordata]|uniref:Uncharacterized protein n=1 Tax=Macleaya cordata TaxID=56857 RepID=A0A200PQE6_MACCD|nr:hypothetical protein BVC80_9089g14 [Macleaya cordata]